MSEQIKRLKVSEPEYLTEHQASLVAMETMCEIVKEAKEAARFRSRNMQPVIYEESMVALQQCLAKALANVPKERLVNLGVVAKGTEGT